MQPSSLAKLLVSRGLKESSGDGGLGMQPSSLVELLVGQIGDDGI